MPNDMNTECTRWKHSPTRDLPYSGAGRKTILVLAILSVLLPSACLLKPGRKAVMPSAPIRIGFVPFNVPAENPNLRWVSMAMPILMMKICEHAPGLEPSPLWETMPFAFESTGETRTITQESAAFVANWASVKWVASGSYSEEKRGKQSMVLDFIPARDTSIPFRFAKSTKLDSVDPDIRKAYKQFLYYLSARPFDRKDFRQTNLASLKQLAEALDREYGWTVKAEPGKADEIVSNLAQSDIRLARLLFNPSMYSVLRTQ